jgi:hypothetical protein
VKKVSADKEKALEALRKVRDSLDEYDKNANWGDEYFEAEEDVKQINFALEILNR